MVGVAAFSAALVAYENQRLDEAKAAWDASAAVTSTTVSPEEARRQVADARVEVALANEQLERWNRIFGFSNRYDIGTQLAGAIHDIALAEGIEPELAFRLVRLESEFKPTATSQVGAVGLTQLMPSTARHFQKGITREQLYDPETNLRIGFRYLRGLIRENDGNLKLALLTYNRGPVAVQRSRREGRDPSNGYDKKILRGYSGDGVVD
ncbi:MAG TPA: transglycosylase SLT domain-containing protein [Gemmatimonadales bacterium]